MAKISIAKILGTEEEVQPLPIHKPWRVTRLPRRILYAIVTGVLLIQVLICYRLFYYETPLPHYEPDDTDSTVALITKYYELLRDMKYIGPNAIAYPPHRGEKTINLALVKSMGLPDRVVSTMLKMPYIDIDSPGGWMGDHDIFFHNGRFVDYRNDRDIFLSRDPLHHWLVYASQTATGKFEEAMMDYDVLHPKSALPLSIVRGGIWATGEAIVLDTATGRIHVTSTQGDGNRDPFFERYPTLDATPWEYRIKTDFYGAEVQAVRSAKDFLGDLISKTAALKSGWVPGSVYQDSYAPELSPPKWENWVRDLYYNSGWRGNQVFQEIRLLNNTRIMDPWVKFRASNFTAEMKELRHNITVKYMPDWFVPVPRKEEYIAALEMSGDLTDEQTAFAKSNEKVIPLDLKGWGATYLMSGHWDAKGRWRKAEEDALNNG